MASAKKVRVPDDKVGMLTYKNQRLAERVEEQRREIRQLESRLDEYDRQQEEYQETLMCVNRLWLQLNADIVYLVNRTCGKQAPSSSAQGAEPSGEGASAANGSEGAAPKDEGTGTANGLGGADPFVEKLLRGATEGQAAVEARAKNQDAADRHTDLESGLRARMAATNEALASLLQLLDAERERYNALLATLPDGAVKVEDGGPPGGDGSELARLAAENAGLRSQLDAQQALSRTVEGQLRALQDGLDKDRVTIQQLQTELADKIEQVAIAQRKAAAAEASTSGTPPAPAPTMQQQPPQQQQQPQQGAEPGELQAKADDVGLQAEVEELRKLLTRRSSDLQSEKEHVARLQREVRDARNELQNESHVLQSRLYQLAQKQMSAMGADIDKMAGTIDALQRDLGIAHQHQQDLKLRAEAGDYAQRRLVDEQARINDLTEKLAVLRAERDELELQLHRDRERFGNARTVEELTVLVSTLQKENGVMRGHAERRQMADERVAAAGREVAAARAKLEAKERELGELAGQLDEKRGALKQAQAQHAALEERVLELRLFVEVLLSAYDDSRDLAEVRLAERSLQEKVAALTQQLADAAAGNDAASRELKAERDAATARCAELEGRERGAAGESIALRKEVEALQEQLQAVKDECDAYMGEIETIGNAYEDMQGQNTRLLAGITERDELNNKLLAERTRAVQQQGALAAERDCAVSRAAAAEAAERALKRRVADLEAQLQAAMGDAASGREAQRAAAAAAEARERELRDAMRTSQQTQLLLEAAERQGAERKRALEEEGDRLVRERAKRQRLEDDVKVLQGKVGRLRGMGESVDVGKEVQEEVQGLRALLRCSVCSERRKDTIITKCYHMFCSHCIQRNLETRHRKCPGCNIGFGTGDVKSIYFS